MPTLITQTSNPTLWSALESDRGSLLRGWVYHSGMNYLIRSMADGSIAYDQYTSREQYDSGSLKDPAGGQYTKLDDGV